MPGHVIPLAVFLCLRGRMGKQVDHIGAVEIRRQFVQKCGVRRLARIVVAVVRHCDEEKAGIRLHGLEPLDDGTVPSRKGVRVFRPVVGVDIGGAADRLVLVNDVVDPERENIRLTELVLAPKALLLGKCAHIIRRRHAAAGEIPHRAARVARQKLPPRIVEHVMVIPAAVFVERFEFTRGQAVADAADRAENADHAAARHHAVKRL